MAMVVIMVDIMVVVNHSSYNLRRYWIIFQEKSAKIRNSFLTNSVGVLGTHS